MAGVALLLAHPRVADVSCEECRQWVHTGDWQKKQRGGKPVPRPPHEVPPCRGCPKISTDVKLHGIPRPEEAIQVGAKVLRMLGWYLSARAGAPVPNDPVVHRAIGLVEWVMLCHERGLLQGNAQAVSALLAVGGTPGGERGGGKR